MYKVSGGLLKFTLSALIVAIAVLLHFVISMPSETRQGSKMSLKESAFSVFQIESEGKVTVEAKSSEKFYMILPNEDAVNSHENLYPELGWDFGKQYVVDPVQIETGFVSFKAPFSTDIYLGITGGTDTNVFVYFGKVQQWALRIVCSLVACFFMVLLWAFGTNKDTHEASPKNEI